MPSQQITEVVRGADLLRSTAGQILLQHALGLTPVSFFHTALLRDEHGVRLAAKRHERARNPHASAAGPYTGWKSAHVSTDVAKPPATTLWLTGPCRTPSALSIARDPGPFHEWLFDESKDRRGQYDQDRDS